MAFSSNGIQGSHGPYGPLEDFEKLEAMFKEEHDHLLEMKTGEYGFHQLQQQHSHHQQPKSKNVPLDEQFAHPSSLPSSLELLRNYGSGFKKLTGEY